MIQTYKTPAWEKGQKIRAAKAKEICDTFQCPAKGVIHWDGNTLLLRGRVESKRVCVYWSGVEEDKSRKLLPEADSGKGADEFEVVKECMLKWGAWCRCWAWCSTQQLQTAASTLGPAGTHLTRYATQHSLIAVTLRSG